LIVDDDQGFLRAARALLEQEGLLIVGLASTRAEAVQRATDLHPDVTLVDIDLGGDSGFDVVRRLIDDPCLDAGHLILMSAHSEVDFADLIEESPAIGFLGKLRLSAAAIETLVRASADTHDRPGGPVRP
jgi:CheY-like chemotaxis protein